jgi:hypothetical protein
LLAGNVLASQRYSEPLLTIDRYWSLELRKADISDIRDISATKQYPYKNLLKKEFELPTSDIEDWLRTDDYHVASEVIVLNDNSDSLWVNLGFYSEVHSKRDEDDVSFGAESFLCIASYTGYFVDTEKTKTCELNNHSNNHCYLSYLAEYPRSLAFKQCVTEQDTSVSDGKGLVFSSIQLLRGQEWEYDYSSNLEQSSINMPCPDLVENMNLHWDQHSGWHDANQGLAAFSHNYDRSSSLFIRKDILDNYLSLFGKSLVFSRYARKQFSEGAINNAKLMEVTGRYVYSPSDGSLEVSNEEVEFLGFEPSGE